MTAAPVNTGIAAPQDVGQKINKKTPKPAIPHNSHDWRHDPYICAESLQVHFFQQQSTEVRLSTNYNSEPACAWRNAFVAEWILLSEGRAAGANYDDLVDRVYAVSAQLDPRLVAQQEWNRPMFAVPDPVATFTAAAIKYGLIAPDGSLDQRLAAFAFDLFGMDRTPSSR
ncbi:MAG TPA: hypothetical protein VF555_20430 [Variovorax sp.]